MSGRGNYEHPLTATELPEDSPLIQVVNDTIEAIHETQGICKHDKVKVIIDSDNDRSYSECVNPSCDWFEEL